MHWACSFHVVRFNHIQVGYPPQILFLVEYMLKFYQNTNPVALGWFALSLYSTATQTFSRWGLALVYPPMRCSRPSTQADTCWYLKALWTQRDPPIYPMRPSNLLLYWARVRYVDFRLFVSFFPRWVCNPYSTPTWFSVEYGLYPSCIIPPPPPPPPQASASGLSYRYQHVGIQ